jgi:hypothetical protein
VGERGARVADRVRAGDLAVAGHGPDHQAAVLDAGSREPGHAVEVDHDLGRREAQVHQRHEALAAGQDLGVLPVLGEERDALLRGRRREVLER